MKKMGRKMGIDMNFSKQVYVGKLKIEISVAEKMSGFAVFLTASDHDENRLWRTALTDANGNMTIYPSISDAIESAELILENSAKNNYHEIPNNEERRFFS